MGNVGRMQGSVRSVTEYCNTGKMCPLYEIILYGHRLQEAAHHTLNSEALACPDLDTV